uniref:Rhodopsin domain-containing protein n=1 Tax=Pyricularia oryzae (strain P131) TaxID=1143193 RepID=L7JQL3_PYRO1
MTKFQELQSTLSPGFSQPIFLSATDQVVDSVLALAPEDLPTTASRRGRNPAPWIHVVAASADRGVPDEHVEAAWFRDVFKVAIEVLADELWWIVDSGTMPLRRITRGVKGEGVAADAGNDDLEDIWWSTAPSAERLKKLLLLRLAFKTRFSVGLPYRQASFKFLLQSPIVSHTIRSPQFTCHFPQPLAYFSDTKPDRTTGRFGQCLLRLWALVIGYATFAAILIEEPANSATKLRAARFDRGELTHASFSYPCALVVAQLLPNNYLYTHSVAKSSAANLHGRSFFLRSTVHLSSVYTCKTVPREYLNPERAARLTNPKTMLIPRHATRDSLPLTHPDTSRPWYYLCCILPALAIPVLLLRLWTVSFIFRRWRASDTNMGDNKLFGVIFAVTEAYCSYILPPRIWAMVQANLLFSVIFGVTEVMSGATSLVNCLYLSKLNGLVSMPAYCIATGLAKASVILYLLNFTTTASPRAIRIIAYATLVLSIIQCLILAGGTMACAASLRGLLDLFGTGISDLPTCTRLGEIWVSTAMINSFTDLVILLLPVWILRPLQVGRAKKIGVLAILMAGDLPHSWLRLTVGRDRGKKHATAADKSLLFPVPE